jgi:opacity protein-like surface antigen
MNATIATLFAGKQPQRPRRPQRTHRVGFRSALCALCGCFMLALATPTHAQDEPALSIRPFVFGTVQSFAAVDTFDAVFGRSYDPFFGGGVQVVFHEQYFVELSASRFKQTGQRAFIDNGRTFGLGIPLTATITPFEVTGGYRFKLSPRMRPYVAVGVGTYRYTETSNFSDATEDVDVRHAGFVLNGGADFRVHSWVSIGADVQYTRVPGIIGTAGVSQQAGESDLGGVAGRLKLIVGR